MKTLHILLFCFAISLSYSQDPQLFQYDWQLEQFETSQGLYLPDPNDFPPNSNQYDKIVFYDDNSNYSLGYGVYQSVTGAGLVFDNANQSFTISGISATLGEAGPSVSTFFNNFLFLDALNDQINNPFSYDFTFENNLIYLDITNGEGFTATFFDNFLSQQDFLKDSIAFYPNPVNDVLLVKSLGIGIDSVKIYDLNGRLVLEKVNVQHQINVSQLEQGTYILDIETAVGVLREELVKK